jgi:hypothetical protein
LLAHELVHVVQQKDAAPAAAESLRIDQDDSAEREADEGGQLVESVPGVAGATLRAPRSLQRKIKVEKPDKPIPNPGGKGVKQTNAETVADYLGQLCSADKPKVDPASGKVTVSPAFCSVPTMAIGHEVLPTGPAAAEQASTPTGCTCLCDLTRSKHLWKIKVEDVDGPHTDFDDDDAAMGKKPGGTGGVVTAPSPNSRKIFGAVNVSGQKPEFDPWLILGHELCGHGWLGTRGESETEEVIKKVGRQPATIDRENALRAEHGLEARGRSFRDPFCGESFFRLKSDKPGTTRFDPADMATCKRMRARCKKAGGGAFKIDERIPDDAAC